MGSSDFIMLNKLSIALIVSLAMPIKPARAILNFVGSDLTTNDAFRTSSVVKSLDSDGDNIYGTDGYTVFRSDSIGVIASTNNNIVQTPSYARSIDRVQNKIPRTHL